MTEHNRLWHLRATARSTIVGFRIIFCLHSSPELLQIILSRHEEHAKTVQTQTHAQVVHKRDPKVSRGQGHGSVIVSPIGFQEHGHCGQDGLDIDVLKNTSFDEQKRVRIAHLEFHR